MKKNYIVMKMLLIAVFMLPLLVNAQAVKDSIRRNYTQQDYENFLLKEKRGEIPKMDGPVTSGRSAGDALVNNNAGSTGTYCFTQSETTILTFGDHIVIGFNDSGSYTGGANKFTGWSYSTDGGSTFTDGGALPTNTGGDAGDPVLARDETSGRIYYSTLQWSGSGIQIFRSDDDGVSWMLPVQGAPGKVGFQDKQWIAVDNFSGSEQGNVYLVVRDFGSGSGIYFYKSTDDGASFGPNGGTFIVSGQQGAFVTVGTDHSVYVFWLDGSTIKMRKSTDQGATFATAVVVATGLDGPQVNKGLSLTGLRQGTAFYSGFRSNSFPHAAVNPVSGHLYVTFNDNPAGADKGDIYMVMSTDGGATWSARTQINDDGTTTDQWQPTLAVSPDGNNIGIFYFSRQDDETNNNLFTYNGRTGVISGSTITFDPSFVISDIQSLPEFGRDGVVNSTYMGDYNSASATNTDFHVVWSDNRDNLSGGGDRKDPNVYYKSIPIVPPCTELVTNTTQSTTYCTLQEAIAAANADDNITIAAGTLVESGQIVIDKNLTISGAGKSETVIMTDMNTGDTGDAKGWWLVSAGVEFNLSDLTLDGTGYLVNQAIRSMGSGTIDNVRFTEIKYEESGPEYGGVGAVVYGNGNVDISNCMFDEIGRDGVLYFGAGITGSTFSNNMYTGKGDGDWLDYGVEIGAGAVVLVNGNTFTDCTGISSPEGSISGGVLVSTYFGDGTEATVSDNLFTDNLIGVIVGSDPSDGSVANVNENNFAGNTIGVLSTGPVVDAKFNYWGTADGPITPLNDCGTGDAITENVTFLPFYADASRTILKSSCLPDPSGCDHFTVYLIDSNGDPLAGGLLEYQDGGYQTAAEISDGVFCISTTKSNINLKMTYAEAPLYVTVPTSSSYTFQTVLTTFELRKRTGDLGYNWGEVSYAEFGDPLGYTGEDGLGLLQRELLPREYKFKMKFRGGRGDITQDVSVNPVVTWQMARMLVQLNKSDGTRGLNGADIKYKGTSLEHFGVTGTSENGRARKDLLPGFYKFTIKYLGGSMVVENFEVVLGDNELIIDGVATTVELLDSDNSNAPLDGGTAKNTGYTSNLMGTTGDSGPGIVTVDLLPIVYSFSMSYGGDKETKTGIDITSTPWVTFYTADLKTAEVNSEKDIALAAYPNPFNGNTTIAFVMDETQDATIAIYDINGRLVEVLHEGLMESGNHKLIWNASSAQKGMYFVRFNTNGNVYHKNIVKM